VVTFAPERTTVIVAAAHPSVAELLGVLN